MLGEVVAIQGQIEWSMQATVCRLLNVDGALCRTIMGSTSVEANSTIWVRSIRDKASSEDAKLWAEWAYKEIARLAQGRNDFVHAVYGIPRLDAPGDFLMIGTDGDGDLHFAQSGGLAIRVKNREARPAAEIAAVRAGLAKLSCVIAHINGLLRDDSETNRAWREKLGPPPQPTPPKAGPKKAKAQRPPPQS